jgi:hypothetical protein
VRVTLPSVRVPFLCLVAMLAVLVLVLAAAAPAAEAKSKSRGTPCAVSAGALRPSPLRACVRTKKAPRALPSSRPRETASRSTRRRPATRVIGMMGRLRA